MGEKLQYILLEIHRVGVKEELAGYRKTESLIDFVPTPEPTSQSGNLWDSVMVSLRFISDLSDKIK